MAVPAMGARAAACSHREGCTVGVLNCRLSASALAHRCCTAVAAVGSATPPACRAGGPTCLVPEVNTRRQRFPGVAVPPMVDPLHHKHWPEGS